MPSKVPSTPPEVQIRSEMASDADAIDRVITRAFAGHPLSDQSEARIVRDLREAGSLSLSLVAETAGAVGHGAPAGVGRAPLVPLEAVLRKA